MLSANYIDILNKKIDQSILSPTATRLQIDSIHFFGTSEHLDLKI